MEVAPQDFRIPEGHSSESHRFGFRAAFGREPLRPGDSTTHRCTMPVELVLGERRSARRQSYARHSTIWSPRFSSADAAWHGCSPCWGEHHRKGALLDAGGTSAPGGHRGSGRAASPELRAGSDQRVGLGGRLGSPRPRSKRSSRSNSPVASQIRRPFPAAPFWTTPAFSRLFIASRAASFDTSSI